VHRTLFRGGLVMADAYQVPAVLDILVGDGTILDVRADLDAADADEIHDLRADVVLPAFVDAHAHVTETALLMSGVDLTTCRSVDDVLVMVDLQARKSPEPAILGHGWDELELAERRPPTAAEIERRVPGRVVYLSRVDVHSAVVSGTLADHAGLRGLPGWDESGRVERDAHHAARDWTRSRIAPAARERLQRTALRRALEQGIAYVHEMSAPHVAPEDDLVSLATLADDGDPRPRVVPYRGTLVRDAAEARDVAKRFRDRGVDLAGLAGDLVVDGAVGSRTACFHADYHDAPGHRGHLYLDAEQIAAHVAACTRAGLQAGFHVIGDAAVTEAVEGFVLAAADVGADAVRAARHRLEHVEAVTERDVARLAALGLLASVQPAFDAAWGGPDGMYATRLGPARAARLNPFAGFVAGGVPLALGSDSPVTPFDPWGAVRACVLHQEPAHRISLSQAIHAHTAGGHLAAGRDGGVLRPGAEATFTVWRSVEQKPGLPDLAAGEEPPECVLTVVAGRIGWVG
jgi:predicted amidohydrolase YtcJ